MTVDLVRRWHAGWTAVRGYEPDPERDGVVATPTRDDRRWVDLLLLDADTDRRRVDRACQRALAERDAWLTAVTADAPRTVDHLGEHGLRVLEVQTLMTTTLADHPVHALSAGLVLEHEPGPRWVRVRVGDGAGDPVASGQAGVTGADMVADRIGVEQRHRRRGVASAMMTALAQAAEARGATTGVLVASPVGRRLYESLGWRRVCELVVADQG